MITSHSDGCIVSEILFVEHVDEACMRMKDEVELFSLNWTSYRTYEHSSEIS